MGTTFRKRTLTVRYTRAYAIISYLTKKEKSLNMDVGLLITEDAEILNLRNQKHYGRP